VFDRLDCYSLKLKPSKCSLFQRKVSFLGHVISGQGIECDPEKVAAIATWPTPTSIAEVRTFCGLASYYRAFAHNFAAKAKPSHNLTRKGATFSWTPECEAAFQELKQALTSTPILVAPCDGGQYVLDTDASDTALGAVLQQVQGDKLHVIGYASRMLNPYIHTYIKALLANRTIGRAFGTVSRLSVVCLSVVVCDVLYCGETVHPSEKVSEGVNRKPGSKTSFLGSPPYFYFRFRHYSYRDGRFCLIFARTAKQSVLDCRN